MPRPRRRADQAAQTRAPIDGHGAGFSRSLDRSSSMQLWPFASVVSDGPCPTWRDIDLDNWRTCHGDKHRRRSASAERLSQSADDIIDGRRVKFAGMQGHRRLQSRRGQADPIARKLALPLDRRRSSRFLHGAGIPDRRLLAASGPCRSGVFMSSLLGFAFHGPSHWEFNHMPNSWCGSFDHLHLPRRRRLFAGPCNGPGETTRRTQLECLIWQVRLNSARPKGLPRARSRLR